MSKLTDAADAQKSLNYNKHQLTLAEGSLESWKQAVEKARIQYENAKAALLNEDFDE